MLAREEIESKEKRELASYAMKSKDSSKNRLNSPCLSVSKSIYKITILSR